MDFLNGFNASLIVYGQTGSGKTFTMFGNSSRTPSPAATRGIVPRACEEILEAVKEKLTKGYLETALAVSYVEVYGDQVTDLLKHGQRCGHSKASAQRFVLVGAAEQPVSSMADLEDALTRGDAQKRRAETAMNQRSSRAHSLFIISLRQTALASGVTITSKLFFADLGGSEQVG
jgi:kinesin family member 5